MKLTEKENLLLRRALDPASSANEAETAMAAFARSLRKRGVSGYDFVPPNRQAQPQGPQARPSDTPPPPPPPPPKPEPPPFYEQAYKHASEPEPEPTRWETPPEPESRFGRWIGSRLYRIGFLAVFLLWGAVSKGCHPINIPGAIYVGATPTPAPQQVVMATPTPHFEPRGSSTNPYTIDWQKSDCFKLWEELPNGSWYIDSHGQLTKKLPSNQVLPGQPLPSGHHELHPELLAAASPIPNPSGIGSRANPRRFDWKNNPLKATEELMAWKPVSPNCFYVDGSGYVFWKDPVR